MIRMNNSLGEIRVEKHRTDLGNKILKSFTQDVVPVVWFKGDSGVTVDILFHDFFKRVTIK